MTSAPPDLSKYTNEQLKSLRINCHRQFNESKDPAKVKKAEDMLLEIEDELTHRYLPGSIEGFFKEFPEGFYDPKYLEQERNFKLETSKLCHQLLDKERFAQLISDKDWKTLAGDLRTLVNKTNMLQATFERPQLIAAFADADKQTTLMPALYDCLHGEGTPSARLGRYSDVLQDFNLGKWTFATYFLFLNDPQSCMFIKPESIKRALEISQYPAEYDSAPSATLYGHFLEFAAFLKSRLAEHKPRDMIDIQSFIWIMAPTGIHSKE
jgi:hypothetical protein